MKNKNSGGVLIFFIILNGLFLTLDGISQENLVLENPFVKINLKKYNTYILNSLINKKNNSNLLSEVFIWYQGKSTKEDRCYENLNERDFKLINITQLNKFGCIVESENIDFWIKKKIKIDEERPIVTITYILRAKNNYAPKLKLFPLINLSSLFEKFYIWDIESNNLKKFDFKEIKKKQLSTNDNVVIFEDKNSENVLCLTINSLKNDKVEYFSIEDVGWGRRIGINHLYADWRHFLKKDDEIDVTLSFYLLPKVETEIIKKLKSVCSFKLLEQKEKEKKYPSSLSYKLIENPLLTIWYEHSIKKIYPMTTPPENCNDSIKLTMAKNEGESFSLSLLPKEALTLTNIKIIFKNTKSVLKEEFFEIYYLEFLKGESPLSLKEEIPDKLVPILTKLPLTLEKGRNNILWFTIYTPSNISADKFKGEISLQFSIGKKEFLYNIPIEIKIWNFELPKKLPFRAFGLLWRFYLLPEYFPKDISSDELDMKYIKCLAKYHINTNLIADSQEERRKIFDGKIVNLEKFEIRAKEMIENFNYNVLSIPNVYLSNWQWKKGQKVNFLKLDPETEEFEYLYSLYLKSVSELLEKNGWLDIAILYIWDEIYGEDAYSLLKNKLSKIIWNINSNFKIFIVGPMDKDIVENCNIICPGDFVAWWNEKTSELIKKIKKENKEVWVYLNSETFIPFQPAIITRLVPWKCFTRGITGYLQWSFDYWKGDFTSHGSAWLFHPTNHSYPLPSVRLEYFRDGIEDYAYFEIFKNLCMKKNRNKLLKKFEKDLLELIPNDGDPEYEKPEKFIKFREQIGNLIEDMNN